MVDHVSPHLWGRTGFDRGSCGIDSEPGFHQPEIRWKIVTANNEYALAA